MSRVLVDGYGQIIRENDKVKTSNVDGKIVYGILKKGKTFRSENEWYVEYDDGEEYIVLEPKLLFKA